MKFFKKTLTLLLVFFIFLVDFGFSINLPRKYRRKGGDKYAQRLPGVKTQYQEELKDIGNPTFMQKTKARIKAVPGWKKDYTSIKGEDAKAQEEAARKIQAAFRGFSERKKSKLSEKDKEMKPPRRPPPVPGEIPKAPEFKEAKSFYRKPRASKPIKPFKHVGVGLDEALEVRSAVAGRKEAPESIKKIEEKRDEQFKKDIFDSKKVSEDLKQELDLRKVTESELKKTNEDIEFLTKKKRNLEFEGETFSVEDKDKLDGLFKKQKELSKAIVGYRIREEQLKEEMGYEEPVKSAGRKKITTKQKALIGASAARSLATGAAGAAGLGGLAVGAGGLSVLGATAAFDATRSGDQAAVEVDVADEEEYELPETQLKADEQIAEALEEEADMEEMIEEEPAEIEPEPELTAEEVDEQIEEAIEE